MPAKDCMGELRELGCPPWSAGHKCARLGLKSTHARGSRAIIITPVPTDTPTTFGEHSCFSLWDTTAAGQIWQCWPLTWYRGTVMGFNYHTHTHSCWQDSIEACDLPGCPATICDSPICSAEHARGSSSSLGGKKVYAQDARCAWLPVCFSALHVEEMWSSSEYVNHPHFFAISCPWHQQHGSTSTICTGF